MSRRNQMDKARYVDSFRTASQAIATAARRDRLAPLPSCPGWTSTTLLGHLATVYISVAKYMRDGTGVDIVNEVADLDLDPAFVAWYGAGRPDEHAPPDVIEWFEGTATRLAMSFADTDPAARCWTWFEADQTAGFWLRRMVHETAIHAWDAHLAYGTSYPIDSEIAADGVDEALTVYQAIVCRAQSTTEGTGETYHFHRMDGPGEWLVRFEGANMSVSREHTTADVAIRGNASDLMLFLWNRIPSDRLEIYGDQGLVTRYFDLVPPD
jgi:uncharacterized protein (TIGR03083 family)